MRLECGVFIDVFLQIFKPDEFVKPIDSIEWTEWFASLPTVTKFRCQHSCTMNLPKVERRQCAKLAKRITDLYDDVFPFVPRHFFP
jgi:hypothetical protein